MGKPYGHQYFFVNSGCITGTMICPKCNQPIMDHAHDWVSYQKSCKDDYGWDDWKYVTFHRKCYDDQSGWIKIEKAQAVANNKHQYAISTMEKSAQSLGITNPYDFARLAAEALGCDDLDRHYFLMYGSC